MEFESATDLPRAWGEPLATGRIKTSPGDFIVREVLDIDFDGQGEHVYLHIRKCGLNTHEVEEQLQRQFRCGSVDVGVSGLKDKNAVTDQWFSVRSAMNLNETSLNTVDVKFSVPVGEFVVLESHRHSRKLRRGAHRNNRFILVVRELAASDLNAARTEIDHRLGIIAEHGFVNYFGPQRFGFGQQNLVKAERYFSNPKRKISRVQRSLLISSARSLLFNRVCAERVKQSSWNVPMPGEPMLLSGSHSFFVNTDLPDKMPDNTVPPDLPENGGTQHMNANEVNIAERCRVHDVHPTGPLWGEGEMLSVGDCQQFELEILKGYKTFTDGLEKARLKHQRRALRAEVEQLQWHWGDSGVLTLDFSLAKGVYATSFLSELVTCV